MVVSSTPLTSPFRACATCHAFEYSDATHMARKATDRTTVVVNAGELSRIVEEVVKAAMEMREPRDKPDNSQGLHSFHSG